MGILNIKGNIILKRHPLAAGEVASSAQPTGSGYLNLLDWSKRCEPWFISLTGSQMFDLCPPTLVCWAHLVDHCAEQIKSTNLQQSGEVMCLFTSTAPLGWEHLLSHPNNLGSGVKANETGLCVCPRRTWTADWEYLQDSEVRADRGRTIRLLKRCLVARQLMA